MGGWPDGGAPFLAVAEWRRGGRVRTPGIGVQLGPRRYQLRRPRPAGDGSTRRGPGLRTVRVLALTNDEAAVLRLVAAGAASAHDVARFGGPDVVNAVKVLVGLERKGLVERRILRDGAGAVRHAAHFLTPIGQHRIRVA